MGPALQLCPMRPALLGVVARDAPPNTAISMGPIYEPAMSLLSPTPVAPVAPQAAAASGLRKDSLVMGTFLGHAQ